ncbi:MAG: VWA-like domain-containing protein [Candidatus Coproplasma sp.]
MELSDNRIKELTKRLLLSRTRILLKYPFYGLLLMHVAFRLDFKCSTAYTDGRKIAFCPDFLDELTDSEVDTVMLHEIMHIVLRHCFRGKGLNAEQYNIACDIVVNSNIVYSTGLGAESIALKCDKHPWRLAPDGKEGYLYTAEEVYAMLPAPAIAKGAQAGIDSHDSWDRTGMDDEMNDLWGKRIIDAARMTGGGSCAMPYAVERQLEELKHPKHDWRTILANFVQEEVNDYSFAPPDRRYGGDFFLPDFNDAEASVKKVLFMIDTSGSMSEETITGMYSEICGAIEQFNGKLSGWLGFFDAEVIPPKQFNSSDEFRLIKPKGGGGTSFNTVFDYVRCKMKDDLPSVIIILTDGYADFPKEKDTLSIPVMWVINTDVTPPFGKVIRV